ncbi:MAG: UDP-3-O-acyl-N-acetylglucosamine deacetylase [Pseudomonadota bacterium]
MRDGYQTTLRRAATLSGIGVHSGAPANLRILPASAEYGIWFKRTDAAKGRDVMIPALYDCVVDARLNTRIGNPDGMTVSTIEHLMAALGGAGISNALIEIDGPEVPILDGSAAPFLEAILAAGVQVLSAPARRLRVLETVEVADGPALARLEPVAKDAFEMAFEITFPDAAIGHQTRAETITPACFAMTLANSRTFGRAEDVAALRAAGLALGGSLDNAVVVEGARVLNPGGFRHSDECVRHKMLDAVGDLALAGAPIAGRYTGVRAGHAMTNALLRALFARPTAWRLETLEAAPAAAVIAAE